MFRLFAISLITISFSTSGQSVTNKGIISISGAQFTVGNDLTNDGTIINNGNLLISGAWINNGTYDPGVGQITFNSPVTQIVNHNNQAFKRLTISGGGVKQFLANITIEDELDLSDGNLVSQNGARIIIQPGAVITGGSDQSHIVGPIELEGSGNLFFPIGNGTTFLPVELINVSGSDTKALLTLFELTTGILLSPQSPVVSISAKRYWQLDVLQGSLSGSMVSLPLRDEENLTNDFSLAVVTQSIDPGQLFENLGRFDNSGDLTSGSVTSESAPTKSFLAVGVISDDNSIIAFNGISPNGDGMNEYFKIANIEKYPENRVSIFNRWGDKVFEITGYDNDKRIFAGDNNITGVKKIPSGTYFYRIELKGSIITGYLELKY